MTYIYYKIYIYLYYTIDLLQKRMRKLRCLIILPTRDLVQQVYKGFIK
jgi:superfamily II DNA/RNA helicase